MSLKAATSGTSRDVPVVSDARITYAPVEQTRLSYSVPVPKPKK
jgi:hypothetical protein